MEHIPSYRRAACSPPCLRAFLCALILRQKRQKIPTLFTKCVVPSSSATNVSLHSGLPSSTSLCSPPRPPQLVPVEDVEYLITQIMILASPGRSSAVLYPESLIVVIRKMLSCCAKGQEAAQDSALLRLKLSRFPLSYGDLSWACAL